MQELLVPRVMNDMSMPLEAKLEALLFFIGGPVRIAGLAQMTGTEVSAVTEALQALTNILADRGIRLILTEDEAALGTAPELYELIESVRREELEGPLGKAGLETLAIILYRGPISRSDIEYIRGVNATSSLRTLQVRGLVERIDNPSDKRSFLYRATSEVPAYLGLSSLSELPDFEKVAGELRAVAESKSVEATVT